MRKTSNACIEKAVKLLIVGRSTIYIWTVDGHNFLPSLNIKHVDKLLRGLNHHYLSWWRLILITRINRIA